MYCGRRTHRSARLADAFPRPLSSLDGPPRLDERLTPDRLEVAGEVRQQRCDAVAECGQCDDADECDERDDDRVLDEALTFLLPQDAEASGERGRPGLKRLHL